MTATYAPGRTTNADQQQQLDPGDEDSRQALIEKTADEWVARGWHILDPTTREVLAEIGYSERGTKFEEEESSEALGFWGFEMRRMIGLSVLASRAQSEVGKDERYIWPLMLDDEALGLAATVLRVPRLHALGILELALRLVMVTQAARAKSIDQLSGRSRAAAAVSSGLSTAAVRLGSMLGLPVALGALPTFASEGRLLWAIASAFALVIAGAVLVDAVISEGKDKRPHSDRWFELSLALSGSSTGEGFRSHLESMIRDKIAVPPIAIDLCHALQAANDRRVRDAFRSGR